MEIKNNFLRTIFIGDIHGCLSEFNLLLEKINYNHTQDRVILLGDLIDRGPDSVGVVRQAREMNLECIRGNHEDRFLKWFRSQGSQVNFYDPEDFYTKLSDDDIQYIANMPLYIELNDVIAIHAGLRPNVPLQEQKKESLLFLRKLDSGNFWTSEWTGPKNVVYAHEVHSLELPLIQEVSPGVFCYGIDTGACFEGRLTALIWETKEIVQVKSPINYYESGLAMKKLQGAQHEGT